MDLTVNNRVIAAVEIWPVQLAPLLGAFELVISFSGTVHAAGDGIYRSLMIAGARIAMRARGGLIVQMGRAVPDNGTIIRQNDNATLAAQPLFADAFLRRRAIVPASEYYQRRTIGGFGERYVISRSTGSLWRWVASGRASAGPTAELSGRTASSPSKRAVRSRRSTIACRWCWSSRTGRCG